ncbi:hypothetical protein B0H14DRAFT_1045216 [Mycena olivaceomarginata]|nr:hypothetical protein B0H14DRAFT_1045216 [Mycena olivaceomarginata]
MFLMPSLSRTYDMRARTGPRDPHAAEPARCGGLASLVGSALICALGRRPAPRAHPWSCSYHILRQAYPPCRASSVRWRLRSAPMACPLPRPKMRIADRREARGAKLHPSAGYSCLPVYLSSTLEVHTVSECQDIKMLSSYTRATLPDATCSSSLPGPACGEHCTGARPSARHPLLVTARHPPHTVLRPPAGTGRLTTCMHIPRRRRLHAFTLAAQAGGAGRRGGRGWREEKGGETSPSMCRPSASASLRSSVAFRPARPASALPHLSSFVRPRCRSPRLATDRAAPRLPPSPARSTFVSPCQGWAPPPAALVRRGGRGGGNLQRAFSNLGPARLLRSSVVRSEAWARPLHPGGTPIAPRRSPPAFARTNRHLRLHAREGILAP